MLRVSEVLPVGGRVAPPNNIDSADRTAFFSPHDLSGREESEVPTVQNDSEHELRLAEVRETPFDYAAVIQWYKQLHEYEKQHEDDVKAREPSYKGDVRDFIEKGGEINQLIALVLYSFTQNDREETYRKRFNGKTVTGDLDEEYRFLERPRIKIFFDRKKNKAYSIGDKPDSPIYCSPSQLDKSGDPIFYPGDHYPDDAIQVQFLDALPEQSKNNYQDLELKEVAVRPLLDKETGMPIIGKDGKPVPVNRGDLFHPLQIEETAAELHDHFTRLILDPVADSHGVIVYDEYYVPLALTYVIPATEGISPALYKNIRSIIDGEEKIDDDEVKMQNHEREDPKQVFSFYLPYLAARSGNGAGGEAFESIFRLVEEEMIAKYQDGDFQIELFLRTAVDTLRKYYYWMYGMTPVVAVETGELNSNPTERTFLRKIIGGTEERENMEAVVGIEEDPKFAHRRNERGRKRAQKGLRRIKPYHNSLGR